jgi:hypothetical protein
MYEKLKSWLADDAFFMAILVLLVAVVSFGLGRQSVIEKGLHQSPLESPAGVILTDLSTTTDLILNDFEEVRVVASKSGTKYHLPNCPGAVQIKEENRVFFDSIELAKAAGYSPASNCPGLQ